jgi:Zn-dependent protease with chaperone function
MAVHGYITHARRNRRFTAWLVLAYILAFQLIGAVALTMVLLLFDEEHTILTDPAGYAVRYALPLGALTFYLFWRMYRGHAKFVTHRLGVRLVARSDEPRFFQVAEEQCTALGVRVPRFGVIEAEEPNAVTVGEGPNAGLIAVTRGLLDRLDDDELAAVLAHEASHIRNGDTRLLAANHALMRTAILLQTHNPLRIEDWRQMLVVLLLPPMLLIMLAGSAATMFSMQLARVARRGLKLGRDHIADGEAIRVTHFPEAMISALRKIGGRGAFDGSYAVEGLLFDGPSDQDGGSHSAIADRIASIANLGGAMMDPNRARRDTRQVSAPRPAFGRRDPPPAPFARDATGRPLEQPPTPTLRMLWLYFTDREAFWRWQHACIAWQEWRIDDRRNAIGLTPKMVIPVAATCTFLLVFHWPADGDPAKLGRIFSPTRMVEIARMVNSEGGTFSVKSTNPSAGSGSAAQAGAHPTEWGAQTTRPGASEPPPMLPPIFMPILLLSFIVVAIAKPAWLRSLFGVVEAKKGFLDGQACEAETAAVIETRGALGLDERPSQPPAFVAAGRQGGFGRKRV